MDKKCYFSFLIMSKKVATNKKQFKYLMYGEKVIKRKMFI